MFYWISGYLFKNKEQPFKCFIKNKLKRLLIPYWVYGVALTFIGTIVFVRKKRYLFCILRGVKNYDSKSDFASKEILSYH